MKNDKHTVLLLGAGFIGNFLINHLAWSGYEVKVISRTKPENLPDLVTFYSIDDMDNPQIWDRLTSVIYSIHQDRPSDKTYIPELDSDWEFIQQFLERLEKFTCRNFIYLSSGGAVYGIPEHTPVSEMHERNPVSAYGKSKKRIEDLLIRNSQKATYSTVILRPSNVYGPQDSQKITGIVNYLLLAAKNNKIFTVWGDGEGLKGYLHVNDLVQLIVRIIQHENKPLEIFNVCSEEYYSPNELLDLFKHLGYPVKTVYEPHKPFDVSQITLSSKAVRKIYGWQPEFHLKEYIQAYLLNA